MSDPKNPDRKPDPGEGPTFDTPKDPAQRIVREDQRAFEDGRDGKVDTSKPARAPSPSPSEGWDGNMFSPKTGSGRSK